MSIGPAQNFASTAELPTADPQPPHCQFQSRTGTTEQSVTPDLAPVLRQETQALNDDPVLPQPVKDEVHLQHDSELKNDFIITYLDPAGHVVLQVPSQVLRVDRQIAREFEHTELPCLATHSCRQRRLSWALVSTRPAC